MQAGPAGLARDVLCGPLAQVLLQLKQWADAVGKNADDRANWLPAPEGPFYLAMRIYWPEPAALDGTWKPPRIERV